MIPQQHPPPVTLRQFIYFILIVYFILLFLTLHSPGFGIGRKGRQGMKTTNPWLFFMHVIPVSGERAVCDRELESPFFYYAMLGSKIMTIDFFPKHREGRWRDRQTGRQAGRQVVRQSLVRESGGGSPPTSGATVSQPASQPATQAYLPTSQV